MRPINVNLKGIVTETILVSVFVLSIAGQSFADEIVEDPETELLLALSDAEPAEADQIALKLQAMWSQSGSPSMDLLLERGRDALEAGEIDAALDHLSALTDHAPDFAEGWHLRATAFFTVGRVGMALDDLSRALHLNPNNFDAIFGLGLVFEQLGDADAAQEAYERAQAIHPHHEDVSEALTRLVALSGKTL